MFRILTVFSIVVAGIFFLTDPHHLFAEDKIERLSDKIVLDLFYKKRTAIARFEFKTVKQLYSKHIVTEVITPDGGVHRGGYRELRGLINDYARTGVSYEKTLLNHAVVVANDGQSAVLRMEAIESWRFSDEFRNTSGKLIETQRWVLENGVPRIASVKKEHGSSDTFYLQRRGRMNWRKLAITHHARRAG